MGEQSNKFNDFIKKNPLLMKANDLAFQYMLPLKRKEKGKSMYNHVFDVAKFIFDAEIYDIDIIASAFLHDIIEDSYKSVKKDSSLKLITKKYLTKEFNSTIANIVENLTNVASKTIERKILAEFEDENVQNDENLYKLKRQSYVSGFMKHLLNADLLNIAESVLLIKFFDRFHNMRTLEYHKKFKQTLIAKESLDIYIPLFYMVKQIPIVKIDEMIEMTFKYLYPHIYENRKKYIVNTEEQFIKEFQFIQNFIKERNYKNIKVHKKTRSLYRLHLTKSNFTGLNYAINEILIEVKEPNYKNLSKDERLKQVISSERELYDIMTQLIHLKLENGKNHYVIQDDAFKYSLNFHYSQSYLSPLPAMRLKLYTRKNYFMFQLNLTTESKMDSHHKRRDIKDWIKDLKGVEDNIVESRLTRGYNRLRVDFLKPVTIYTPRGRASYHPNNATIRDFAFKIHTELGIFGDYALINGIEKVSLSEKVKGYHGNVIEIVLKKDIESVKVSYQKIYSEIIQASSERDMEANIKKGLKKEFPNITGKDLTKLLNLFKKELKARKKCSKE